MTAQLINIEKPPAAPPPYHLVFGEPSVLLLVNTPQIFAVDETGLNIACGYTRASYPSDLISWKGGRLDSKNHSS